MQLSLSDVLAPSVEVIRYSGPRPYEWLVSYPDGKAIKVRRTPRADQWAARVMRADGSYGSAAVINAGSLPAPSFTI